MSPGNYKTHAFSVIRPVPFKLLKGRRCVKNAEDKPGGALWALYQ